MAAKTDNFQSPDYFNVDELLSEEHKLIRESVRSYVKKEISPIIEDYAQRAEFPQQIVKQMGDLGCFGPTVPVQYGGGGLDYNITPMVGFSTGKFTGISFATKAETEWKNFYVSSETQYSMAIKNNASNFFAAMTAGIFSASTCSSKTGKLFFISGSE